MWCPYKQYSKLNSWKIKKHWGWVKKTSAMKEYIAYVHDFLFSSSCRVINLASNKNIKYFNSPKESENCTYRSGLPEVFLRKRCSKTIKQSYSRTPMPRGYFNKVTLQLYWNQASAWPFSCKFTAYFKSTFS